MASTRKKASLYVRLSKQAGESNLSGTGMMEELRQLADRLELDVYSEHMDDGISGAVRDRPEFVAWLDDARNEYVDVLLPYHADRLTREGVNAAALVLDVLEGKDPTSGKVVRGPVRLVSHDGLDSERDAESFRWRFVIAAEVARAERERIKARNIATRKRLDSAGRYTGGAVPFGCRVIDNPEGPGKALSTEPDEAEVLRAVAQRLIAGESMRSSVRWMNSRSSTRRGKDWIRSSLRATLLSDASRVHVFDLATFRALEARLSPTPAERSSGGRPRRYLLAGGMASCGTCGRKITTSAGRYICSSSNGGEHCEYVVTIKAEDVDTWLAEKFLAQYGHMPALEARVIVSGGADIDAADRAVEDAEKALLADLTPENMAAVQDARAELQKASEQPTQRKRVWMPTGQTIAERWETSDHDERADLLTRVLDKPVVIVRNPAGRPRGRVKVDVDGRLEVSWGGNLVPL